MITKIFRQIWYQRKANSWLCVTLAVIAVAMWYCVDVIYNYEVAYRQPLGFNPDTVFNIQLRYNWTNDSATQTMDADNHVILNLIKDYPDVEACTYYFGDEPFTDNRNFEGYCLHSDSSRIVPSFKRVVSPEFFDVFGIKPIRGSIDLSRWNAAEYPTPIIITEDFADSLFMGRKDVVGETFFNPYYHMQGETTNYKVMAVVPNQKVSHYYRYQPMVYMPNDDRYLGYSNIVVRTSPEKARTFADDFMAEMRQPLERGVFYLNSVESLHECEVSYNLFNGAISYTNALYAFVGFFVFTAFLIVLGAFYIRTGKRRSEIALRMALGSSRATVLWHFILEGLLILAIALVPALIVALNVWIADLTVNTFIDSSVHRFIIIFLMTALFLAIVITLAIFPSAYLASKLQPAVALHDE